MEVLYRNLDLLLMYQIERLAREDGLKGFPRFRLCLATSKDLEEVYGKGYITSPIFVHYAGREADEVIIYEKVITSDCRVKAEEIPLLLITMAIGIILHRQQNWWWASLRRVCPFNKLWGWSETYMVSAYIRDNLHNRYLRLLETAAEPTVPG